MTLEKAGQPSALVFMVRGLPDSFPKDTANWNTEAWQRVLAVFTVEGDRVATVPLLGDYELGDDQLIFIPRYPLRAGLTYRAALRLPGAKEVSRDFTLPEPRSEPTRLTAIFPTTDVVPENLLKFYLHFVKSFRVVEPDVRQPDIRRWKVISPGAGTRDPLTIVFDEPLDSAMLLRVLSVLDRSSTEVIGDRTLGESEMSLAFRPAVNWAAGNYTISVATMLEDLAGNSLGRPFEVDVFRPLPTIVQDELVSIPFAVAAP